MHPGWQRIYCCLFKRRIFQPSKQNDPNSSSFRAGTVRSHACSSPAYLALWSAASHGIGLPLLCLERQVSLGPFSLAISKKTPSSHTLFNSWKTFIENWESADHGLQATDSDSFRGYRPRSHVLITADMLFQREYECWCQQISCVGYCGCWTELPTLCWLSKSSDAWLQAPGHRRRQENLSFQGMHRAGWEDLKGSWTYTQSFSCILLL